MTLLELTVVILVLLALIAVLFIGTRAWKKGSDRTTNILNIRNIQQAVRSHENLYGLRQGISTINPDQIFLSSTNSFGYIEEPKPPSATGVSAYTYLTVVPNFGELYVNNLSAMDSDYVPAASSYADW